MVPMRGRACNPGMLGGTTNQTSYGVTRVTPSVLVPHPTRSSCGAAWGVISLRSEIDCFYLIIVILFPERGKREVDPLRAHFVAFRQGRILSTPSPFSHTPFPLFLFGWNNLLLALSPLMSLISQ